MESFLQTQEHGCITVGKLRWSLREMQTTGWIWWDNINKKNFFKTSHIKAALLQTFLQKGSLSTVTVHFRTVRTVHRCLDTSLPYPAVQ